MGGPRCAARCSPTRAAGGTSRPPTCSTTRAERVRFYAPRLCRSQTDSPSSTDVHAPLRRRATELSRFSEAVMVFLVFSEVPEMSSEVAGPGPTHGRSNLRVLTWDLLLVCRDYQHTTTAPPITWSWWRQQHAHQLRGGSRWPCWRRASRGSTRHAARLHGPCRTAWTATSTSYDYDHTITYHWPTRHDGRPRQSELSVPPLRSV